MGYTTSIKIKDSELKTKVFNFLQRNYIPFGKLCGYKEEYVRGPLISDLSYDHDPDMIGFDYGSGPDGWYSTYLLRVIAINLGMNHTRYDSEKEPFTWRIENSIDKRLFFRNRKERKKLEKELKRISDLWDSEHPEV